jgi:RNA polymerase primary sigma factor
MAARVEFDEGLTPYLRRLGDHPQLTREQEYELSRRAKKGDEEARRTLALSNLAFVVATAKKFANPRASLGDLIQEGNFGLMKAIDHFDPKKNVRFATYAVWWIRAYIMRYLNNNRSQVQGGGPERQRIMDFSLDAAIDDESDATHMDQLEDPDPGPQEQYLSRERDGDVEEALSRVRKRIGDLGWAIVQERLTQDSATTLEELGKRYGVSRERVRQVELKTKAFLARYLSAFNDDQETDATDAAA